MHASNQTMGIYKLIDPRSGIVVYVGRSVACETRFAQHRSRRWSVNKNKLIRDLVEELEKEGLAIQCEIIEECSIIDLFDREAEWISHYKDRDQCAFNRSLDPRRSVEEWRQMIENIKQAEYFLYLVSKDIGKLGKSTISNRFLRWLRELGVIKFDLREKLCLERPDREDLKELFDGKIDS